jgi:hypothetical protein
LQALLTITLVTGEVITITAQPATFPFNITLNINLNAITTPFAAAGNATF